MSRLVALAVSFLFTFWGISGQDYTLEVIGIEQGLSQSTVNAIAQDNLGFLWIGTQDGLNRYDGRSFTVFKKDPFDSTSISDNYVTSLLVDHQNRLWVGTLSGGLNLYDPINNQFIRFDHAAFDPASLSDNRINIIYEDNHQNIWVGTSNGLNRVVLPAGKEGIQFERFQYVPNHRRNALHERFITSIMHDSRDHLWVGTYRGLYQYEYGEKGQLSSHSKRLHYLKDKSSKKSINVVYTLAEDALNNLWIGTAGGLLQYIPSKEDFNFFTLPLDPANSKDNTINKIICARNGDLVLATRKGLRVLKYKKETYDNRFITIKPPVYGDTDLVPKHSTNIIEDLTHQGLFWVGTDLSGLRKMYERKKKFYTNNLKEVTQLFGLTPSVFHMVEDSIGNMYLNLGEGLVKYHKHTGVYEYVEFIQCGSFLIKSRIINVLYRDQKGNIWAGTFEGLIHLYENEKGHIAGHYYWDQLDCSDDGVFSLYEEEGEIYMGTYTGVNYLDKKTNKIQPCSYKLDTTAVREQFYNIRAFMRDRKDNVWIGTYRGLILLRNVQGPLKDNLHVTPEFYYHDKTDTNSLVDNLVNHIVEDKSGAVWLATMNGLARAILTDEGMRFESFGEKDGLANNVVYGILEEDLGDHLWLSTNNGLTRFDPANRRFYKFDSKDALQSNEFNGGAFYKNEQGKMFFGGINGYTSFFPDEIKMEEQSPPVWITNLTTNTGREFNILAGEKNQPITLNYDQNSFTVKFVGIDYLYPDNLNYYYDLEGGHAKDMFIGKNQQIYFNELPPGAYNFCVKAENKDGVINSKGDSLQIVIRAPFWRTSWFYFLSALALLLLTWLVYYLFYRFKMNKIEEIEKVRKIAAQDFHDELGSKLSIISMYSDLTQKQLNGHSGNASAYLNKVITTSNSLYDSMKDLLWSLNPEQDTINDLFLHLKDFGDELFSHSDVNFQSLGIESDWMNKLLPMQYKRHVLLIFKESMNNCYRHAQCKEVKLKMSVIKNILSVEVSDDGVGFDVEEASKGEGLNNIKSRARKISGKLLILSNRKGTQVKLICPLV